MTANTKHRSALGWLVPAILAAAAAVLIYDAVLDASGVREMARVAMEMEASQ